MESEIMVRVENLTKSYGDVRALNGVSFVVKRGEIYGLLGPNGAGKTTTIKIIVGLLKPDSGNVSVLEHSPVDEPQKIRDC